MQSGPRPRIDFPACYKGYDLLRTHGRVFAIPPGLEWEKWSVERLARHPAVVAASSLEEIQVVLDRLEPSPYQPEFVEEIGGYDVLRLRGEYFAVPKCLGAIDLDIKDECRRKGVLSAGSLEAIREQVEREEKAEPIEFAGWLPIFRRWGNCGQHPQFNHVSDPPPGYRFTCSQPADRQSWMGKLAAAVVAHTAKAFAAIIAMVWPLLALFRPAPKGAIATRFRLLRAIWRVFRNSRRAGARIGAILHFLKTRHFQSQLLLGDQPQLVFLTSMPYTFGQRPWLIEIEDPTTLFFPLVQNGQTSHFNLSDTPYFPIVKSMLEAESCRGIITHMKSTADMVGRLFDSDIIRQKISYAPLGVGVPKHYQTHQQEDGPIDLLFINSWCQVPENFFLRGGLDVLEAFAILRQRYPQLRLTLRTRLPLLDEYYHRLMRRNWVRVIDRFLPTEDMEDLLASSHIFLLPAARVHIVSLLQAMSYGLALVTSDGWGIEEYVTHEHNGLVVPGRYGKVSWADEEAGMLREDYQPMCTPNRQVIDGLVEAISRLVEDVALRRRLGQQARRDVETKYSLAQWNRFLKSVFDKAKNPAAG